MQQALASDSAMKDVGHAGTAMRFLTAYFSVREGSVTLTGSDRMKQRPMWPLIEALRKLGAVIECLEKEGYPPMKITGGNAVGGAIDIDGSISSQFISALMMVGPVLRGGLKLTLTGQIVSETYIRMTLALMKEAGIEAEFDGRHMSIPQGEYRMGTYTVEADWSAASYWYQVAALLPGSAVNLPFLKRESLQGDAILASMFHSLGVTTQFREEGIELRSNRPVDPDLMEVDFLGAPDLVQTCAVTCCALGVPFHFTGTSTLLVKETDRIAALRAELGKTGFRIGSGRKGESVSWDGSRQPPPGLPEIRTYHDHRMAMAFAPLAILLGEITIADPEVVTKSYPGYWEDLKKAGFSIRESDT
jgi:3-phosphoshikimate 1-carboxyvinyltransferase